MKYKSNVEGWPITLFLKEIRVDVYRMILCRTAIKRMNTFVYSSVGIAASAPALEEEVVADLPADEPSPEQVILLFFFLVHGCLQLSRIEKFCNLHL